MKEKKSTQKKPFPAGTQRKTPAQSQSSSKSSAFHKQFLLAAIAVLLLGGYFSMGHNKVWFEDKILVSWDEFMFQKDKMDFESRMSTRFGSNYTITKSLADFLKKRGSGNKLILLPPNDYLTQKKVQYRVPEPAIFYYYTGLKTVWANNEMARKASWFVKAENGQLFLDSVLNQRQLDSVIDQFRKYKISL